jgi:hypothetical protein
MTKHRPRRFSLAHIIRRLSVPILLFWLALGAITNVLVPPLEDVGNAHTVSLSPEAAPSLQATKRIGHVFQDYARYVIDCNDHSADVQQATRDEMHWVYAQTPEQSRAYSGGTGNEFRRSPDGCVAEPRQVVLQQQGRCRAHHRRLAPVPAG